ncbi:probable calcium-binding protein CML41 [Phalaenopsis equestris]|uniref:probable calcium-binding protein CML41 n=1 Tax=Phalaenopsis equestris TaxID=78828 RepID=UPI0009E3F8E9|nr:probable calcium-binding protein CML41 [Phalaenopsis equestris]
MANLSPAKNHSKWFPSKALMKLSLHRLRWPKKPAPAIEQSQDCFREMFRRFDSDGDGRISSEELQSFLAWAGDRLSANEAAVLVQDLETDNDGLIDYDEFVRLVGGGQRRNIAERDYEEDLRRAFKMFEGDDGSGCITPNGLKRVLGRLGEKRTEEECAAMIRVYDLDGNGVLDYHEFHRMMS